MYNSELCEMSRNKLNYIIFETNIREKIIGTVNLI